MLRAPSIAGSMMSSAGSNPSAPPKSVPALERCGQQHIVDPAEDDNQELATANKIG